jgi:hypothetical protein
MWLCFGCARPDRIAAEYNADRFGLTEDVARNMLYELSVDAVPVMARYESYKDLPPPLKDDWERYLTVTVDEKYTAYGVRSFNFALFEARNAVRSK